MQQVLRVAVVVILCLPVAAQETIEPRQAGQKASQQLPDAPSAARNTTASRSQEPFTVQQDSDASPDCLAQESNQTVVADAPYEPLSNRAKLNRFLRTTTSPFTFASAAMNATWLQINGEPYSYGGGMSGWGTRFGTKLVDTEIRSFFSQFFYPTLLNQDPRYFPRRKGNLFERGWYAATRVLVVRSDSGKAEFNTSYLLSVASSRAIANAYAPEEQRNLRNTMLSILGAYGSDAGSFVLREFFPDIMRIFRRHAPQPVVEIQEKIPDELIGVPPEAQASDCSPAEASRDSGRHSPARNRDCPPGRHCRP